MQRLAWSALAGCKGDWDVDHQTAAGQNGTAWLKRTLRRRAAPLLRTVRELTVLMKHDQAYLHDDEVPMLARYARVPTTSSWRSAVRSGATALVLAHKRPGTVMHSIDPFIVDSMADFQATESKCRENVALVLKAAGRLQALDEWVLHADYSHNVVKHWREDIDMLFIDGDHGYNAVRRDFNDWFPKVRDGGVILLHDSRKEPDTPPDTFNRGFTGPTRLAGELASDSRLDALDQAFSITAWRKCVSKQPSEFAAP